MHFILNLFPRTFSLAAKKLIQQLQDSDNWGENKEEIIEVGCRYGNIFIIQSIYIDSIVTINTNVNGVLCLFRFGFKIHFIRCRRFERTIIAKRFLDADEIP